VGEDLATLLRRRGLRVTAQRIAVLRAVSSAPHVTADAVAEAVRADVGAISLQAVYDALAALADVGLVRRIQPAGSPALFETRIGDNHHHVICRSCGRVADVDCATGQAPCLEPADDRGFQVDHAEVIYWGRCPGCASQAPTGAAREASHGQAARPRQPGGRPDAPTGPRGRRRSTEPDGTTSTEPHSDTRRPIPATGLRREEST
jgi:Fur family ferric uptake transcriptional regulator